MTNDQAQLDEAPYHDFPAVPGWGVILGVTVCNRCGKVATEERLHEPCILAVVEHDDG